MTHATRRRDALTHRLFPLGAVIVVLLFAFYAPAAPAPAPQLDELRLQAQKCETDGNWSGACRAYDELIRIDRGNLEARESYHRCYRQYQIARRHSDHVYRDALTQLTPTTALDIYDAVLTKVPKTYVDPRKTELKTLFQHGIQEVRYALAQPGFVQQHLTGDQASTTALDKFKDHLTELAKQDIKPNKVRNLILSLADQARKDGLVQSKSAFAVVLSMEFAFGACAGLDEYTLFLTPENYTAAHAALNGKSVGIGIDLVSVDGHLEITRVYPNSPAEQGGLLRGDRITRIDEQSVEKMRPEDAAARLRGEKDSTVGLEFDRTVRSIEGMSTTTSYKASLQRQPVLVPSVDWRMERLTTGPGEYTYIGVLKIMHFQESTVKEVQEALAQLQSAKVEMNGVILDLRGNPGGSFPAAVKVAELFLPEGGVIVNTDTHSDAGSQDPYLGNKSIRVPSGLKPLTTPMCVLIDSETASSAELLAGALKENKRGCLIGQTTFGKGTIQCIIPLKPSPGGIRITVAKFMSPDKNSYANVGVSPHYLINSGVVGNVDPALNAAFDEFKRMMMMPREMMPMMTGTGSM